MERKKDIREIEYYINGKLYKTCPYGQWDKVHNRIREMLYKMKFVHNYSNEYANRLPRTWDVYVLPEKYKVIIISHKIFTGHYDKNGNKIYDGDTVSTPYGFESPVYCHWGKKDNYYVREERGWMKWTDYDIEDWSKFVKVKDVNDTPRKYWKNPETTDKSILK